MPAVLAATQPGEEERNRGLLEEERKSPEFHDFEERSRADIGTPAFRDDTNKYGAHLVQRLQQVQVLPTAAALKHNHWSSSLTDGAYPTAEELNTGFEMWVYLIKRVVHFASTAKYAPSGGTSNGLGRSNPWSVTKNMLASNGDALSKLGINISSKSEDEFPRDVSSPVNTPHIWGFNDRFDDLPDAPKPTCCGGAAAACTAEHD